MSCKGKQPWTLSDAFREFLWVHMPLWWRSKSVERKGPHSALSGFTLPELLVVSMVLMLIGGGLLTIFLAGQASYLANDATIQVQQEARKAFDNMVRELRESGKISCNTGPPPAPTGRCDHSRLNFQIAKGVDPTTGTVIWGNDLANGPNEYVHYAIITGTGNTIQLVRFQGVGTGEAMPAPTSCSPATNCRVLANNVKRRTSAPLEFEWDASNRIVTIRLEIAYQNPLLIGGSRTTGTLTTPLKLRNP